MDTRTLSAYQTDKLVTAFLKYVNFYLDYLQNIQNNSFKFNKKHVSKVENVVGLCKVTLVSLTRSQSLGLGVAGPKTCICR